MSFKSFISQPEILKALEESGLITPTPIQEKAIPVILKGCDIRASAQTGTGKTAAFLLPALCKLSAPSAQNGKGPRVLILVPTRELAMQVAAEAAKFSKYLPRAKTVCIYGGAPYPAQIKDLSRPYDILVATPGRLIDHLERGRISFSRVEMLILDEADRMLDMGFFEPVKMIAEKTPASRQTLLFSATLKGTVLKLSEKLLKDPKEIAVAAEFAKHELIEQHLLHVDNSEHKMRLLDHFLNDPSVQQAIIFTSTKRQASELSRKLGQNGQLAGALHGDMNQRQRSRTIMQVRQGKVRVLIATDVAARGIDVQTISHVINFDLPRSPEDYVHRIGRTGRAGATGTALSFASPKDRSLVREIEKFTGQKLSLRTITGIEPKLKVTHEPQPASPSNRHSHKKRFFSQKKRLPFKKPAGKFKK